jgi:hypothetical protein
MEQLGSLRKDSNEIWHLSIFLQSIEKFQISLKCDKNNEYFIWKSIYIRDIISEFSLD